MDARQIAEAFSGHRFEEAFPFLADDVVWRMPGSDDVVGRDAVMALCRSTAEELADTGVTVERFLVIDGGDNVAVDTLTTYAKGDAVSTVASCDVYETRDGMVARITSYAVDA